MHLLIWILLLAAGSCEAAYWQKLTCPYEPKHESQLRVWCRQSSTDCCSGLAFGPGDQPGDGDTLRVTQQDSVSFTVEVLQPSGGEGVYWCGVLVGNNTIIKLAEGYIHSPSGVIFARWILLPLLPMVTIFTNIYSRRITKQNISKEDGGA